jgi:HYDIN/CFA65/VesB-like, Ig-like domain
MTRLPATELWLALLLAAGLILPCQAFGQMPYDVQVGYAENVGPPGGFFPNPWDGSPGVTNFVGSPPGSQYDAGAIRIDNTSGAPLLINDVSVLINGTGPFDLWGSFTIPAGGVAILTQTAQFNFDTSEAHPISTCGVPVSPGTKPFPTVTVTANGTATTFNDTAHVLDTGGFDLGSGAGAGCNAGESFQWRLIGTTGGQGGGTLSPTSLNFGSQLVGSTSAPQVAALSNTGTGALTISSVSVSGDFAETNNCPASVAAGSNCTISVTFTPAKTGTRSGTLTVTDNAASGSTQTVSLMGTGTVDFTLSAAPKSASVSPGTSASYMLTLTPRGGFNQAVQVTCAEPTSLTESTCTVSPASVTLNGSTATSVAISVTTTAPSFTPMARQSPTSGPLSKPLATPVLWLAVLGLLGQAVLLSLRKKRGASALLIITALMVLLWASCGGGNGGGGGQSSNPGTAAGTFNITLSASGGNITHTTTVALTVQ